MEQIKELTKRLIANSFKELLLQMPFEKITIKMITDHANVIRPTFYNHFHDKYELVEWIVQEDILNDAENLFREESKTVAVRSLISGFYNEREFYKRAFEIIGQNGFEETLANKLVEAMKLNMDSVESFNSQLDFVSLMAKYYASGIITVIRYALFDAGENVTIDDMIEMYKYLVNNEYYKS